MGDWLERRTDSELWALCAGVLFALCAWPLLLVEVPPFQDVPNHLAVATIIEHAAEYPEYVVTGLLKTNAAVYAWEHTVGRALGETNAVRLFVALTEALASAAFTRLLLVVGGRRRLLVGSLFLAPMIHPWGLALGLLDFSLGVPLAVAMLVVMLEHRRAPSALRALLIAALGAATWYAHIIALFLAHVLVGVELVATLLRSRAEAQTFFVRCILPLVPATLLALSSVAIQLSTHAPVALAGYHDSVWLPPWDLAYNLWAEWLWAFTYLEASTLVPCLVLVVFAWRARKEPVPLFGPGAFLVLLGLYACVPYVWSFWAYANTRVAPFLWLAALVRVPTSLPRPVAGALAAATLAFSAGLGIDYRRLDEDRKEFTAGVPYVPEHARLLPLVFTVNGASVNTHAVLQDWGFYVAAKRTAAPRAFATSRWFGVVYREAPPKQLVHVELERFSGAMRDPRAQCHELANHLGIHVGDCEARWRDTWREFWDLAEPRYDWLLLWDPEPITETVIPPEYKTVFRQGRLVIMHR